MSSILLEIITPKRIAFSQEVEMVSAPTSAGIIGVLPHHMPLFTRLVEGELKIGKTNNEELYLAIGGGFMEITKDKVLVLVTEAYHADEINEAEVLSAKKRAEEALKAKPEGAAFLEAQSLFKRSVIALKVSRRRRGRSDISSSISS